MQVTVCVCVCVGSRSGRAQGQRGSPGHQGGSATTPATAKVTLSAARTRQLAPRPASAPAASLIIVPCRAPAAARATPPFPPRPHRRGPVQCLARASPPRAGVTLTPSPWKQTRFIMSRRVAIERNIAYLPVSRDWSRRGSRAGCLCRCRCLAPGQSPSGGGADVSVAGTVLAGGAAPRGAAVSWNQRHHEHELPARVLELAGGRPEVGATGAARCPGLVGLPAQRA